MAKRIGSNPNNPMIISWGSKEYDGRPIDSLTPIHKSQQIYKYRLGLFATGLVGLVTAIIDLIFIAFAIVEAKNGSTSTETEIAKATSTGITVSSIIFVIALLIDIIFTINLNRYLKSKRWLILYIPCLVLMITFSVPQLLKLLTLFNISIPSFSLPNWANTVNIAVCGIFIIAEAIRIIIHWNDIDIAKEVKKALR